MYTRIKKEITEDGATWKDDSPMRRWAGVDRKSVFVGVGSGFCADGAEVDHEKFLQGGFVAETIAEYFGYEILNDVTKLVLTMRRK